MALQDWETISSDPAVQAAYEAMRRRGESHALAEMLALGSPPMSNTDREFLEGRGGCYEQFKGNPAAAAHYAARAREAGLDTTGKVYLSGLAAFPGDPEAWVTGRGDVRRVCEQRGWGCEGAVSVKATQVAPAGGRYQVAPDLVEHRAKELVAFGAAAPGEEATHMATEQLSPR